MTKPEAGQGATGPTQVQILVDLGACLKEWHKAASRGTRPAALTSLQRVSADLQPRLAAAGFGGIAFHLGELMRRAAAGGAASNTHESLQVLFQLSEQARQSLPLREQQAMLTRVRSPAVSAAPPGGASSPPQVEPRGFVASPDQQSVKPGTPVGPGTIRIGEDVAFKPPGASSPAPGLVQAAVRAPAAPAQEPFRAPAPPPPAVWTLAAGPSGAAAQAGAAAARPAPKSPSQAPSAPGPSVAPAPAPNAAVFGSARPPTPTPSPPKEAMSSGHASAVAAPAPSPPMEAMGPPRSVKPPSAPNVLRTMFGLRAFSDRPAAGGSGSAQHESPSVLGLKRRSSSSSSALANDGRVRKVQDLLGKAGRSRSSHGGSTGARSALSPKAQRKLQTSRIIAIAAALVVLLGAGVVLVVVLTRRADDAEQAQQAAAARSARKRDQAKTATLVELPQTRLLDADESYRALLTQVHGRGNESPELRALVDEQAALAAGKCEGSSAACQKWVKTRESLTGGVKRITRRRATGSPDRINSGWMMGFKMPEIPVENDPRVQRKFEYYAEGTVGRELFQAMLFRCGAYRDLIEATLIRYGLPLDLIAIVFTESGCEPQAVSPVGAAGLWQFMPETARAYHLRVKEGVIDERRSPPKSTEAAVRFLRDLHDKMVVYNKPGVWDLVFGSFNLGPFGMAARAEKAGGDVGFWDLVDAQMLPDETAQYTPTVQAVALILNNLQKLKFAGVQMRSPQLTSDLEVPAGTRLSLVARAASTSVNRVRSMNLDISSDRTPALPDFAVQVPKDVVFQARDTLNALIAAKDESDLCVAPVFDWGRERFTEEMAAACQRKLRARRPSPK